MFRGRGITIIQSLEFIPGNFCNTWDLLCAVNNSRQLVHNHVKALFELII